MRSFITPYRAVFSSPACMQILHVRVCAFFAFWRAGKFFPLAKVHFLHSGFQRAFFAFQVGASAALLLSARFARDSYDDSFNYLKTTLKEFGLFKQLISCLLKLACFQPGMIFLNLFFNHSSLMWRTMSGQKPFTARIQQYLPTPDKLGNIGSVNR